MNKRDLYHKRAFTFVELFIVVALFSLLSLAVYATFVSGMRLWHRVNEITLSQRKVLLGLERISQNLRQALNFPKLGFSGKANEVSFPIIENNEIILAAYLFEDNLLVRNTQRYKDILEENEEVKSKTIIPDLEGAKFSFGYKEADKKDYTWKELWKKEDGIPLIVRIELKTKDNNFFNRLIIIPLT